MKTTLPFLIAVLLISAVLIACSEDDPTATPAPTITPTAAPTSTSTAIPTIMPTTRPTSTAIPMVEEAPDEPELLELPHVPDYPLPALTNNPAEHTLEQIARSDEALTLELWRALLAQPEPDLQAAAFHAHSECQSNMQADLTEESVLEIRSSFDSAFDLIDYVVTGVARIDDTQAWVKGHLFFDGYPRFEIAPGLLAFENGQWRDAACRQWPDGELIAAYEIEDILRVSYIGETVQHQYLVQDPPYAITVLGEPEIIDETTLRVPTRFTSVVERWDYKPYLYLTSAYLVLPDANGSKQVWEWTLCGRESVTISVTLVKGGWLDGFLCFRPEDNLSYQYEWDEERGRPDSWLRLIYYGGESDSHPLLIDLTQSAEFADPVRFEGGVSDGPVKEIDPRVYHIHWLEEEAWPNGTIGDPIAVSDSGEMLRFEVTVLSEPEVYNSTTVRFRIAFTYSYPDTLDIHLPSFELTGPPDEQGRLREIWSSLTEDESGSPLPDGFHDITLADDESHEGWAYFTAPEGITVTDGSLPTILWLQAFAGAFVRVDLTDQDA